MFKSIERITGIKVQLKSFRIASMTPGEDAQGEVQIEVEHEGRSYGGRGISTDIIVGSAQAFLQVMNRIAGSRPRPARSVPDEVHCGAI